MSEPIRSGLWKKESERGSYYSGSVEIGGVAYWVNLYRNDRKTEDNHPDLNLQLKPKEGKPSAKSAPARTGRSAPPDDDGDSIPFD